MVGPPKGLRKLGGALEGFISEVSSLDREHLSGQSLGQILPPLPSLRPFWHPPSWAFRADHSLIGFLRQLPFTCGVVVEEKKLERSTQA